MTIAIAARGPRAGQAAFDALKAVEQVATGAIGGFAVFAVITAEPRLLTVDTQRGGTATLFLEGERTGTEPPPEVAEAPLAALISSGPDRPEPLSQFLQGDATAGLVTGHRLPNTPGTGGQPINREVLEALRAGCSARQAVDRVLDANPGADAGIIAVDGLGGIYARNSARVSGRPDLGHARQEGGEGGSVVEVLHNAMLPGPALAALAAETALQTMAPRWVADGWITVNAGTPVVFGDENAVIVKDDQTAERVLTTDRGLLDGRRNGAAIYLGATVRQGERALGTTTFEPNVVLEDGRIVSMSGQTTLRLGFRKGTGILR